MYFKLFLITEEKEKRQNVGYGQVGFSYDQSSTTEESTKAENQYKDEPPDEVYVPHPRFYIPPNIDIVSLVNFLLCLYSKLSLILTLYSPRR